MHREHKEIGKVAITISKVVRFKNWIAQTYGSWDAFLKLRPVDKEKVFLRWKFGFENDVSNQALEESEKHTIFMLKEMDIENKFEKGIAYFLQMKMQFERNCFEIKKEIGLVEISREELPAEAQSAMEIFGGHQI